MNKIDLHLLALRKEKHTYIFKYDKNSFDELYDCIIDYVKNPELNLDFNDANIIINNLEDCFSKK